MGNLIATVPRQGESSVVRPGPSSSSSCDAVRKRGWWQNGNFFVRLPQLKPTTTRCSYQRPYGGYNRRRYSTTQDNLTHRCLHSWWVDNCRAKLPFKARERKINDRINDIHGFWTVRYLPRTIEIVLTGLTKWMIWMSIFDSHSLYIMVTLQITVSFHKSTNIIDILINKFG